MKINTIVKRIVDVALTVTLLLLMAFQVTEQLAHEWLGITMFALTIVHQILNRKYYAAIFKGRYGPLRIFHLIVNILLLVSFLCTALSGMMMSRFATPFMSGLLSSSIVRQGHLAMSHWSFVLMGMHLGLHFGIITSKLKKSVVRIVLGTAMTGVSVYGFYLFFKANMLDYMLLRIPFAFLDYTKAWWLVILENLAMLLAWGFTAYLFSLFIRAVTKKDKRKTAFLYVVLLVAVIVSGIILNTVLNPQKSGSTASRSVSHSDPTQVDASEQSAISNATETFAHEMTNGSTEQTVIPDETAAPAETEAPEPTKMSFFDPYAAANEYNLSSEWFERKSGTDYGTLLTDVTYFSTTADDNKRVNILLPPEYDNNGAYPVLYMIHGWGGDYTSHLYEDSYLHMLYGNMYREGLAEPMIIVGVDMYTGKLSVKDDLDGYGLRAAYDKTVDDIAVDLMPFMKENYAVADGRENTAVAGVSEGGAKSLCTGFKWLDRIGYIAGIAPDGNVIAVNGYYSNSYWSIPYFESLPQPTQETMPIYLYLAVGSEDPYNIYSTRYYSEVFRDMGIGYQYDYVEGFCAQFRFLARMYV